MRAKTGDSVRYTVKMVFDDAGQKVEMSGQIEDRVTKVDDAGTVTNEHAMFGVRVKIAGQDIDVSDVKRQTSVFRNTGEIIEIPGSSPQESRFAYATMIVVPAEPVKAGQSWTGSFANQTIAS